jgi:hypothetical protein
MHQAEEFLRTARKAHDEGRLADAHALTLKAAGYLEDAVNLEELRQRHLPRAPIQQQAK